MRQELPPIVSPSLEASVDEFVGISRLAKDLGSTLNFCS